MPAWTWNLIAFGVTSFVMKSAPPAAFAGVFVLVLICFGARGILNMEVANSYTRICRRMKQRLPEVWERELKWQQHSILELSVDVVQRRAMKGRWASPDALKETMWAWTPEDLADLEWLRRSYLWADRVLFMGGSIFFGAVLGVELEGLMRLKF